MVAANTPSTHQATSARMAHARQRLTSGDKIASGRSAVSNGKRLHVIPPGDGKWSRRFRDVLSEIISDLGGNQGLSEGQRQLARRCATLSIMCEKIEGEAAAGADIDLDEFAKLTGILGRTFWRLGLKRQSRDISPTLSDVFRSVPP